MTTSQSPSPPPATPAVPPFKRIVVFTGRLAA
jgi:hypothetical protein